MKQGSPINYKDLTEERREYLFKLPKPLENYFLEILNEKADIVMIHLIYNIILTVFGGAFLLFSMKNPSNWLGFAYIAMTYGLYLQRFVLTLHFASHRYLFSGAQKPVFNFFLQYILCPFFGIPSGQYYLHHVVMHHIENNVMPYDVSSTMTYQRNNFFHFLCYWFRFVFAIWIQLPYYAFSRKRYSLLTQNVFTSTLFFIGLYFLYQWKPVATTWVFIVPFFLSSFALMFGNWCQHILIDPKRHNDSYALTYNLINTPMNKLTYNDGYHVVHHLYSQLHWSKMPEYFLKNQEKFHSNNSLTFEGLDYVEVGLYLFTGRYEGLAKHYVNLGKPEDAKTVPQLVELFKEWLKPIPAPTTDWNSAAPKKTPQKE